MNARDEFYITLSDDLTQHGKKSVLYQYLDEEQERKAAEGTPEELCRARSYQQRIRFYRKQLKAGDISAEEYLKQLLDVLIQKPRLGKRSGRLEKNQEKALESRRITGYRSQDPQPLIKAVIHTAFGHEGTGKRTVSEKDIKAVYEILCAGSGPEYEQMEERLRKTGFWNPPYRKLMILTDAVLDVAIAYDIKEFFFGTIVEKKDSYPVSKRQKDLSKAVGGSRAQRTDKTLKLIDLYCRKKGMTLFGSGKGGKHSVQPSDVECDLLYHKLLEEKRDDVFVPLLIDPVTGCGIYIIGKIYFQSDYAEKPQQYQGLRESCTYGVLYLDSDYGEDIKAGYHICNEFGAFSDYNSARFEGDWSYEEVRQETEESLRELNARMPEGVPDIFRKYFAEDVDPEMEQYRQEVRLEVTMCEKELRNRENNIFRF